MFNQKTFALGLLWAGCVITTIGCGGADRPPLGKVTGTVTMEGDPVENLILLFKPEVGRAATAKTDVNGFYRVEYVKGEPGTKIGPTTVLLEWPLGYEAPFPIPPRYTGANSELKLEVVAGNNPFDIELEPLTEAERKKAEKAIPLE
ncbi:MULTISPECIES: hypothetical protein [unclassified Schlesneria]|uniref:hypothetical protein n=1 Tax=Schlesneria TaxID=656899 RepID=UPI0035A1518D